MRNGRLKALVFFLLRLSVKYTEHWILSGETYDVLRLKWSKCIHGKYILPGTRYWDNENTAHSKAKQRTGSV